MRFAELLGTPRIHHDLPSDFSDFPAPSPSYKWPQCRSILCVDANVAAASPVAFGWVLDAVKAGARLLAADVLFTRTMARADRKWRIRPDSGNLLGVAMMKMIPRGKIASCQPCAHRLQGTGGMDGFLYGACVGWPPERTRLADGRVAGALPHVGGSRPGPSHYGKRACRRAPLRCLAHLTAFMGWSEDKGGGWYPLRHALPPLNPNRDLGGVASADAKSRPADGIGPVKAILGSAIALNDLLPSLGGASGDLDWIVCFGSFPGIAHSISHMFLPALLWPERSTVFFTSDRAVHWCEKTVEPAPGCRSGLDFWLGMAKRFGWADAFPWAGEDGMANHRAFFQWVLEGSRATANLTLTGLSEPGVDSAFPLWSDDRINSNDMGIAPMSAPAQIGPCMPREPGYPLFFQGIEPVCISGEAGPWRPWTREMERQDLIWIHPVTASALSIENGDEVLVSYPEGSWEALAWINRCVPEGIVSAPGRGGGKSVLVQRKDLTSKPYSS